MKKSTVVISIMVLAACTANADKKDLNNVQLDSLLTCYGENTEYTNLDGYYYLPDYGCIYNGKTNKLGNAFVFLIPSVDQKKDLNYKSIKAVKEKIIFLIPKDNLVKTNNSDSNYIPKANYKFKVFLNSGKGWVENSQVSKLDQMNDFVENRVLSYSGAFLKRKMDVNKDGVSDYIEVLGEKDSLKSIVIRDGLNNKTLWKNNILFDDSFNNCQYSEFKNIVISENNFTLEYNTCADNSMLGHRYTTFRVDSKNEPVVIQDNYLVNELNGKENKKPKKINCMSNSKVFFSTYRGRCG